MNCVMVADIDGFNNIDGRNLTLVIDRLGNGMDVQLLDACPGLDDTSVLKIQGHRDGLLCEKSGDSLVTEDGFHCRVLYMNPVGPWSENDGEPSDQPPLPLPDELPDLDLPGQRDYPRGGLAPPAG